MKGKDKKGKGTVSSKQPSKKPAAKKQPNAKK